MRQGADRSGKPGRFSPAVTVIILFGLISMLGDMVYESARSANSQYFSLLGVTAAQVGLVFGIGEFLGYCLRLLAGLWSDKTGKQWLFMFVGYGMLLVVPLMGFTRDWNWLVVLILMERIGKALRNPAKDTVLSSVAQGQVGVGFAFGLQEALDQAGAFLGPLIFTLVFTLSGAQGAAQYQLSYKLLILPFLALMFFLYYSYRKVEGGRLIERMKVREFRSERLRGVFWRYTLFTLVCTAGFVNFSTTGFHMKVSGLFTDREIPFIYALAMGVDAAAALLIGKAYDALKKRGGGNAGGLRVMAGIPLMTALLPFLTLSRSRWAVITGMMLFGVVMGAHETVMRSAISDLTPFSKRGTGYGVFNTAYGLALMLGAAVMGWLYGLNKVWLIQALVVLLEAGAGYLFLLLMRGAKEDESPA